MKSIVILSKDPIEPEYFAMKLSHQFPGSSCDADASYVQDEQSYVAFRRCDSTLNDFEPEEREYIHSYLGEPTLYLCEFNHFALAWRVFVAATEGMKDCLVDDDFSGPIPVEAFHERLLKLPPEDWWVQLGKDAGYF